MEPMCRTKAVACCCHIGGHAPYPIRTVAGCTQHGKALRCALRVTGRPLFSGANEEHTVATARQRARDPVRDLLGWVRAVPHLASELI